MNELVLTHVVYIIEYFTVNKAKLKKIYVVIIDCKHFVLSICCVALLHLPVVTSWIWRFYNSIFRETAKTARGKIYHKLTINFINLP